jgi:hypothetical protein
MPLEPVAPSRWLVVVQREHGDLYQHLEKRFHEIRSVHVLFDRRQGERRRPGPRVEPDQRRADRRRPPTVKEREQWSLFGYRLVFRGEPVSPTVPYPARSG